MAVVDLPGNSKAAATAARQKKDKVVQGAVTVAKPSLSKKLISTFCGSEIPDVKQYFIKDVLIPTLQGAVVDFFAMLFWKKPITGFRGPNYTPINVSPRMSYTYGNYSSYQPQPNPSNKSSIISQTRPDINSFRFSTQADAEVVLTCMVDAIDRFGRVSVNDFYDYVGVTAPFTDVYWGWTNLSQATTRRYSDGYALVLPAPMPINP